MGFVSCMCLLCYKTPMNYRLEHNYKKFLNYSPDGILVSMTKVKDTEDFENKRAKTTGVNFNWFVPVERLEEFSNNEKSGYTIITYLNKKGAEKKLKLQFEDKKEGARIAPVIAETFGLQSNEKQENRIKALIISALPLLATLLFTWLFYTMAHEVETLGHYEGNGDPDGKELMFAKIAELLGTTGSLALGGASFIFFGYRAIMRFMKPAVVRIWKASKTA